jgi:hypothetical protein
MFRRITHRTALNAFVFTGLWLLIGALLLWSPLPGALGIGGPLFAAWLLLFFLLLAVSGSLLTLAALNAAFPPRSMPRPQRRRMPARAAGGPLWAPPPARPSREPGNASRES